MVVRSVRAWHDRRSRLIILSVMGIGVAFASGCILASAHSSIGAPPAALNVSNVEFESGSGSRIHAWLMRGRAGVGAVLLLHGDGSNRTSMEGRAKFLQAKGFTVLAPDFQAQGESPGEHVTYGALESLDAAAGIAYLREIVPAERVGVIGVSMGGAAALLGTGPLVVDAFVLESVYPTIREAVRDRLGTWFGPFGMIGRLLASPVIGFVSSQNGVTEAQLQPIMHIGSIRAPLLLLSGTEDHYTPIAEAESLYAHAPSPKTFWAVDGAGHEDLHAYGPAEYERRVGDFLETNLRTR